MKGARGNGDVIAFIDHYSVTDHCGKQYQSTVRRVGCEVLCDRFSQHATNRVSHFDQRFAHWPPDKLQEVTDTHQQAAIYGTEILLMLRRMIE